jgi:hypothetical protein
VIVVLSDFLTEGWEKPMRQLASRHEVYAVTVTDPRNLNPPVSGLLQLRDAETGEVREVDFRDRAVRRRWSRAGTQRSVQMAEQIRAAGAYHVPLTTTSDYAAQLRRAFARRLHRRGR